MRVAVEGIKYDKYAITQLCNIRNGNLQPQLLFSESVYSARNKQHSSKKKKKKSTWRYSQQEGVRGQSH